MYWRLLDMMVFGVMLLDKMSFDLETRKTKKPPNQSMTCESIVLARGILSLDLNSGKRLLFTFASIH